MINTLDLEDVILLTDVPALLPTKPHLSTVRRWAGPGVRGVRLGTRYVGGRRATSRRFIEEFLRRLDGQFITEVGAAAECGG